MGLLYLTKDKRLYSVILIGIYAAGMVLFVFVKTAGMNEFVHLDEETRKAVWPMSVYTGIFIAIGFAYLDFTIFPRLQRFAFGKFILYKYTFISLVIVIVSISVFLVFTLFIVQNRNVDELMGQLAVYLTSGSFLSLFVYSMGFSIFMNMAKTVADYLGPKAITGALFGKYHRPVEEDLTFIFIDMSSSTQIAEQIGHLKYSHFVQKCFQILAESMVSYDAQVYQFVGDEAVLFWNSEKAKKSLAPIYLFYDFLDRLKKNETDFQEEFGMLPSFKASIHTGTVTATEIHTVKKDIVYHGDILNTCARILNHCDKVGKNLLVSVNVAEWITGNNTFYAEMIDSIFLKGKNEKTEIYYVEMLDKTFNSR
ncbi:adenylate/guanylate cyclase domain-containing protein [Myroides ceti]|uniref:Adenylate/guanylate cyclase domain-containing protein n=1 Tax=Paenimyroides ceti TaxID=395087 RepID=A0ABT8CXY8_9FLAO|nr:adenylate/guanylate cyclase domain-containing protein [Paenimyroides ceti]MDN3706722.1 adenylate/guanylate cyclase domain-containing protein [Paenimyroides ceti]MDN3709397.1 adenylate/guanylate cyclase domain-containing protein [Paenimyroides ceti]